MQVTTSSISELKNVRMIVVTCCKNSMTLKTAYRTHTCNELNLSNVGETVKLSGFVDTVRDHGGLLFIDLRDHYGITQCTVKQSDSVFQDAEKLRLETVITITGTVIEREVETVNPKMNTGNIEVSIEKIEILSAPQGELPLQIRDNECDDKFPEDTRLTYRYLDLRKKKPHLNIILRSNIISYIRHQMIEQGFLEIQTPILTASSPEGARDYLVPSRIHHGKFYALPQAPQQFKQLLMVSGFDRYFQIAPCFRDEDARADRSPGEFYQLDIEMSFASQEDVFNAIEPVIYNTFTKFAPKDFSVTKYPFTRISYADAMLHYGCDKPDMRNPLLIEDLTDVFKDSDFTAFKTNINHGEFVRGINVPNCSGQPRSFFDKINNWAKNLGLPGLGYITRVSSSEYKGPIVKFLTEQHLAKIASICKMKDGDVIFLVCHKDINTIAHQIRTHLGRELNLINETSYQFCWVVDFPMFEYDEEKKQIIFSHNPFSMPQGGLDALNTQNPLDIKAYQYDIVCNGIELSSGAIRNHVPEIMYKAFEIAGHDRSFVDDKFRGMIKAFKYGAPPHGGCAPGIDRMVMLLAQTENIREVIAFPFNQKAQDLMMGAPAEVSDEQLKELHISVLPKPVKG